MEGGRERVGSSERRASKGARGGREWELFRTRSGEGKDRSKRVREGRRGLNKGASESRRESEEGAMDGDLERTSDQRERFSERWEGRKCEEEARSGRGLEEREMRGGEEEEGGRKTTICCGVPETSLIFLQVATPGNVHI